MCIAYHRRTFCSTHSFRRRKSRGPGAGLIVGVVGGLLGLVGVIVLVVVLARGSADISYEKFKAIDTGDTIEGLEKQFGSATKIDPKDWDSTYLGSSRGGRDFHVDAGSPLGSYNDFAREVKSGKANFQQTVTSPDGKRKKVSSGNFEFERPNKFRFAYAKPFEQTIRLVVEPP